VGNPPAYSLVPPTTANYPGSNAFDFKSLPQNKRTEQARALMRAAGFGENNRAKATYMIRATTPGTGRAVAAAIQQMLAQAYLDVTIVPNDMQVFYPAIQVHDFDIAQAGWQADFNDASTFLDLYRTGGGNNWGLYSNPAFDRMMDAAQADADLVSRGRKLAAAEAIALKDHAAMPLWFWVNPDIVWPYVRGWKGNPVDYHRSRWVTIDQVARLKQFA
jgi:oligopeptide transport system substrate-binding protein